MADVRRTSPNEARQRARTGAALLVCAYENDELCRRNNLEGSLSLQEFVARLPALDKNQEIVFYCA